MNVCLACCKHFLLWSKILSVFCYDTLGVKHDDIFQLCSKRNIQFCAAYCGSSSSVYDNLNFRYVFACDFQSILQSSSRYNCRSMLVVVHNRNIKIFL